MKTMIERQAVEGTYLLEPQMAPATGELIIVAQNGGCVLLHLASSLVTVVWQTKSLVIFKNSTSSHLQVFLLLFMLY